VVLAGLRSKSQKSDSKLKKTEFYFKYAFGALLILLALVLVVYQTIKPKQVSQNQTIQQNYVSADQALKSTAPGVKPTLPATTKQTKSKQPTLGEILNSFNDLNKLALDNDTVFVYITANRNAPINSIINKTTQEAVEILKTNSIKVGLYTLSTSAPEYSGIVKQASSLPIIIVSTKGKGITSVDGTITVDKILQAYTSTIKTAAEGGCCPTSPGGC